MRLTLCVSMVCDISPHLAKSPCGTLTKEKSTRKNHVQSDSFYVCLSKDKREFFFEIFCTKAKKKSRIF